MMAFILLSLSFIAKILSMFIKILLARLLTKDAMTLYSLAVPTMLFFITIAQLGLPSTISRIVADQSIARRRPIIAAILIATINNLLLVVLLFLCIPLLSSLLFSSPDMKEVLYAIIPLLPLVTVSGMLKGYYNGKARHIASSASSVIEEIARILFLMIILSIYPIQDSIDLAVISMLSISAGEVGTILFLTIFLPFSSKKITVLFTHTTKQALKYVLSIALPLSAARFTGTLTMFLEPLIIAWIGVEILPILQESYGELHGYILPLISLSAFLSFSLSTYLLPTFTRYYTNGNIHQAKILLKHVCILCISIASCVALTIYMFPQELCVLLYHKTLSNTSLNAVRWMVFPFAIGSIQSVLSVCLTALDQTHLSFIDSLIGSILRLLCLILLIPIFREYALFISLLAGYLLTTFLHALRLHHAFLKSNM